MFNIDFKPTFFRTVEIVQPNGTDASIGAAFLALDVDEFASFDLSTPDGAKNFLTRVLVSVDDVVDGDGSAVASTPDLLRLLIGLPWVRSALARAYMRGIQEASRGNSDGSAAPGPLAG